MTIEDKIVETYKQGKSIRTISSESFSIFGEDYSKDVIARILKRKGVELRTRSEEMKKVRSKLDIDKSFINEEIIEWIDGLMLGDGGISFGKDYKGARIKLFSSQKEWTDFGMSKLSVYGPGESKITHKISKKCPNPIWGSWTLWHPDIANQAKRWYSTGTTKTTIPPDVRITKTSILLWYLGDGSITSDEVKNCTTLRLATCCFNENDIDNILVPKLESIGISCHRTPDKNDIFIESDSIVKFFNFIGEKSPIPCYDYKFKVPEWRKKIKLRDIFSTKNDRWRAMYYIKSGQVSSIRSPGGRLVLLNEEEALKLKNLVLPKG